MKYTKLYLALAVMSVIVACSDDDKFGTEQERTINLEISKCYIEPDTPVGLFVQEETEKQSFKSFNYKVAFEDNKLYTLPSNNSKAALLPEDGSPINIFACIPYTGEETIIQDKSIFIDMDSQKNWIDKQFLTAKLTNIKAPAEKVIKAEFKNQLTYLKIKVIKDKEGTPTDLSKRGIKITNASTSGLFSMTENKFEMTNRLPSHQLQTYKDAYTAEGIFIPTGQPIEIEYMDSNGVITKISKIENESIRMTAGTVMTIIIYLNVNKAEASSINTSSKKE